MLGGDLLEPLDDVGGQPIEADRLGRAALGVLRAGQVEQVRHQPAHPLGLLGGLGGDLLAGVGVEVAPEQVEIGPHDGQRVAKLVGGVGEELALAFEQRAQPLDHPIERHGQPPDLGGALGAGRRTRRRRSWRSARR